MVIWIMGLAGSGKTTLAKLIIKKIKKNVIHIDGDAIRNIFNHLGLVYFQIYNLLSRIPYMRGDKLYQIKRTIFFVGVY